MRIFSSRGHCCMTNLVLCWRKVEIRHLFHGFVVSVNCTFNLLKEVMKMFYAVLLESDILKDKIVVPSLWLDKSNTLCLLPPASDAAEIEALAKGQTSPKHGWKMHNISSIQSFDTYSQAEENIKMNKIKPIMVELDREEVEDRKKRKRKRLGYYAAETDDDEERSSAVREFCFVEGNLSYADASVVKVEMLATSTSSECKRQSENTTENISSSNSTLLHENNFIVAASSSQVTHSSISINTKCPCDSLCHRLMFQSLATLQKQLDDNSNMLYHVTAQLKTLVPTLPSIPGPPVDFPISLPIKELDELQRFNIYLSNQRNFAESIPYFTGLGGIQPRQVLKRIMEALFSHDLCAKMNWKGRGDKTPFNTYTKIHSFVHQVAKQNTRAAHVTLIDVENFMKDWLKMAPMKHLKSNQKKDPHKEEREIG